MIKSFSKCFLCGLLVMVFTVFSCSREEDFVRQHHHKNGVSFEKKSFQELMNTRVFNNAYGKVSNTKVQLRNAQRTELEEQFDFTIVEYMPVKIVTDTTGWITYNILVKKGEDKELEFHNLVMKVKNDDLVAALLKYELTEKAESEHSSNFSKVTVTPLPIENAEKEYPCGTITVSLCYQTDPEKPNLEIPHLIYEKCTTYQTYVFDIICNDDVVWIGGDLGNGNPGSSPGNGGGGTGENPDNDYDPQDPGIHGNPPPDITAPVLEPEEIADDPCRKLNELMQNEDFENAVNSNILDAAIASDETGFSVIKNTQSIDVSPISSSSSGCNVLNFSPGTNWIGFIHCHPHGCDNITRMFSGQDILKLVEIFVNFGPNQAAIAAHKEFFVIMSSSLGTYAIKISNYLQFTNFVLQRKLNTEAGRKLFVDMFEDSYNAKPTLFNSREKDNATSFLTLVNQTQMGLGLYKLNNDDVWEKMEMINSQAVAKPCN